MSKLTVEQRIKAENMNEKWVTDITEFHLFGEKRYLSPVLDLYNGEIIAYTIMNRPVYKLMHDMLEQALERLQSGNQVILHSDQGWHYQMKKYQRTLKQLEQELKDYIHYYNHKRMKGKLKDLNPVEYRTQILEVA